MRSLAEKATPERTHNTCAQARVDCHGEVAVPFSEHGEHTIMATTFDSEWVLAGLQKGPVQHGNGWRDRLQGERIASAVWLDAENLEGV